MTQPAIVRERAIFRRTALDLPLLLFLISSLMGVWAAYDRSAALDKLWLLIGALLLFYLLAWQRPAQFRLLALLCGALGLGVALFFLLTHDWEASPAKFALVGALAQRLVAIRPQSGLQPLHPNVAGGLMAILAPYQIALALRWARQRRLAPLIVAALALSITLVSLFLTSSRGAMLALAAGLALWLFWQLAQRQRALLARYSRPIAVALLLLALAAAALLTSGGWGWQVARLLDRLPGPASAVSRAQLAAHTLDLIADFPFTGGGLASFPGLYSRYILDIPYFFLPNGHNILLDVALEQGVAGALAFLLVVLTTFWLLLGFTPAAEDASSQLWQRHLAGATLASFVALLLHGMVEDTVYGSIALPLLFMAPAFAIALTHNPQTASDRLWAWDRRHLLAMLAGALIFLGAMALPQGRAHWAANLGAVQMARADLAGFPTKGWVHIEENEQIQRAAGHFQIALQRDPQQRTALHRLGLLALERNDFTQAVAFLQRAHALDPAHLGIRKALGYSYLWTGELQQAHNYLQTAPFVNQELDAYIAWWQQRGQHQLAGNAAQMRSYFQNAEFDTVTE